MEARAYLKYARISPRKVSIVLDLIRNKPVDLACLLYTSNGLTGCWECRPMSCAPFCWRAFRYWNRDRAVLEYVCIRLPLRNCPVQLWRNSAKRIAAQENTAGIGCLQVGKLQGNLTVLARPTCLWLQNHPVYYGGRVRCV